MSRTLPIVLSLGLLACAEEPAGEPAGELDPTSSPLLGSLDKELIVQRYPQAAIIPHPTANVKFIFTNFCKRRAAPIIPHPAPNVKENFNYFLHKNLTFLKPLLGKGFRR